ncbi:Uncharacterised protein [Bacteroides xylanisolvens]|nr:Uncharacterised protein [Bacteroides xylanisolvens]
MTDASPMMMVPMPMPTSAKPLFCATTAPQRPMRAFEMKRPMMIMVSVFTPWARTICVLYPVARMHMPSSVPKNQ